MYSVCRRSAAETLPNHGCNELRIHAAGLFVERVAQLGFIHAEALGDAGKCHAARRDLGHDRIAALAQDLAVGLEATACDRVADLGRSKCAAVTAMVGWML